MQEKRATPVHPVLKLLGIAPPDADLEISGVAFDSRQVYPGHAFVCLSGEHVDGNQFIGEAIKGGAACIFSEQAHVQCPVPLFVVKDARLALALLSDFFYGHPSQRLRPLGVTGTNGKTTTTHLVEHIFNAAGRKTGLLGTLGARWPGQSTYQNIRHTTPQSSDLHRILDQMAASGCSHVSMEVSSHALAQKRVGGCHFAVACLTNVSQDHLDFHLTMEQYWRSKRKLFEELADSVHTGKTAVINRDDALAEQFLEACAPGVRRLTYGWSGPADMTVRSAEFSFSGTRLSLATPEGDLDLLLRLTGRFNVYNTMAALLICLAEGLPLSHCGAALNEFAGVPGRFEAVSNTGEGEPLCIVDYAHSPDGLENVLKAARSLVPEGGKLVVVFGCGGDRDSSKRPQMGEIAENLADTVVVTSDNPRTEDPQQIIANILAGIHRINRVTVEPDRARAIRLAISGAGERDVVVVAGKGHENYQILADRTIPFDDRTEVRLALSERSETYRGQEKTARWV